MIIDYDGYGYDRLQKFGPIWGASGSQGFFGEGYAYHNLFKLFGLDLRGLTLTSKTTTVDRNVGNMPLKKDGITPKEFLPKCIYVSPQSWHHASALNAVSLSGPGILPLIDTGEWQKMKEPFFISVMFIGKNEEDRRIEMWRIYNVLALLLEKNPRLQGLLGLQINYSCPNTGHDMDALLANLVSEVKEHLKKFHSLGIPLVPKISVKLPVEKALEIGNDRHCSGLCLSNTILWDDLPSFGIDRKKIFGSDESPLLKREFEQAGGYSGKYLFPLVAEYVKKLRAAGFKKHINAGGGVINWYGVDLLNIAGADSFSLGSAIFLRPWRTGGIIRRAYEIKGVPFPA